MISQLVTVDGELVLALIVEPDWLKGVSVKERFAADILRTLTGVEHRFQSAARAYFEIRYEAVLSGQDWQDWREIKRTSGARRVACPVWPDFCKASEWWARVHKTALAIGWNGDYEDIVIGAADGLGTEFLAPVVLGYVEYDDDEPLSGGRARAIVHVLDDAAAPGRRFTVEGATGGGVFDSGTVTLQVEAIGAGPFTYQWYHDGAVMAGATGAVCKFYASSLAAGSYVCRVSNGYMTVESAAADVVYSGFYVSLSGGGVFDPGVAVHLVANTYSTGEYTFQFTKNGGNIGTAITNSNGYAVYTFVTSEAAAGTYGVRVTSSLGVVRTATTSVVVKGVADGAIIQIQVVGGTIVDRCGGVVSVSDSVYVDSSRTHDGYGSIRNTLVGSDSAAGYTRAYSSGTLNGDFTLEGWIFVNVSPVANVKTTYLSLGSGVSQSSAVIQVQEEYGSLKAWVLTDNYRSISTTGYYAQWVHVAVVRFGLVTTFYVNGSSVGTISESAAHPMPYTNLLIGKGQNSDNYLGSLCAENIIVYSKAIYTSNFTPKARP